MSAVSHVVERAKDAHAAHRARHRPTGFGFALADSVEFLPAEHWDRLTAGKSVFMSRRFLSVVEQYGPENIRQRYALIYRNRQPVAAVTGQIMSFSAARFLREHEEESESGMRQSLARAVKKMSLGAFDRVHMKVFLCGNLLAWGDPGIAFSPDHHPGHLWPGVAEAVYRIRRAERLAGETDFAVVKDIDADDTVAIMILNRFGYRAYESEPDMVLPLSPAWRTFDDYLGALNKKYRKAAKAIVDDVEAAGCRVQECTDLWTYAPYLQDLYLQVHAHNRMRLATLRASFLPALAQAFEQQFRCSIIWRGEEIVGFVTTLKDGDTAVGYFLGYDCKANEQAPIYLRLLQAVIADALALHCRRISFGRTALEPKARLGARPRPLNVCIRHKHPVVNLLVRDLLKVLIPHGPAPERTPFKE